MANGRFMVVLVDVLTVKSYRYAILSVSRRKRREIRTNLTRRRDQKYFHSGRELEGLELNLRNSHFQSRTRTAGQAASHCASWRATRIVARLSLMAIVRLARRTTSICGQTITRSRLLKSGQSTHQDEN